MVVGFGNNPPQQGSSKVGLIIKVVVLCLYFLCTISARAANPADVFTDNKVDHLDIKVIADNWLSDANNPADIDGSGDVNFPDFALLANNWDWVAPPPETVLIPAGTFLMGDHHDSLGNAPTHSVQLDAFYIGRYEVTNGQYCQFLNSASVKIVDGIVYASSDDSNSYPYLTTSAASSYSHIEYSNGIFHVTRKAGRNMVDDFVLRISWYGAKAYCDHYGYRLPTEAEWEYAARGGEYTPYYRFPWGDTISHSQANYQSSNDYFYDVSPTLGFNPAWADGTYPYTAPVGSFSPNGYGLYDMAGNAWEWCNDWYGTYEICDPSPCVNPQGSETGTFRVLRGGSWFAKADF
jgi:formylglycine-generating enzyme required for sulfatase activity